MKLDKLMAAVVTGGASGLGEATARMLASNGAKVAILDMNAERGEDRPAHHRSPMETLEVAVALQGETVGWRGHGRHFGIASRRPTVPESAECARHDSNLRLCLRRAERRVSPGSPGSDEKRLVMRVRGAPGETATRVGFETFKAWSRCQKITGSPASAASSVAATWSAGAANRPNRVLSGEARTGHAS